MSLAASVALFASNSMPSGSERHLIKGREMWLKLRERDITASIVGSLVGAHDFETPYGTWAKKSGKVPPEPENKKMRRGTRLEPVAVDILREERPDWEILYPVPWYYREAASRIGATPDVFAIDPRRKGFGVVQVKTSETWTFKQKWGDPDDGLTPPLWISMQACVEAALTGASWAEVLVIVGFDLDSYMVEIPIHTGLMNRLRRESLAMWARIENDDPPPVTDYGRDGDTVRLLHPNADERLMKDLRGDNAIPALLARRLELQAREADGRAATIERRGIDARLIHTLQDAAYGSIGDGRVVAAKVRRVAGKKSTRVITVEGDRNERRRQVAAKGPQSTDPFDRPF